MIWYVSSQAVIATGCLILGFYVLLREKATVTNRLFFVNSLLLNAVIVLTVVIQFSINQKTVVILQSFYNILLIIFLLESLFFTVNFAKQTFNKTVASLLLVYSTAVFIVFIASGQSLFKMSRSGGLWVYELTDFYFWFLVYSPLLILIVFLMISTLYRYGQKAETVKAVRQARVMMIGISFSCISGFLVLMILPACTIWRIPLLTPYFFAVYLYGVFYAIVKYRFLSFRINDILQDIIPHIRETIIILGSDGTIIDASCVSGSALKFDRAKLTGLNFLDLIIPDATLVSGVKAIMSGGIQNFTAKITYRSENENVLTDSSVSRICDRFGDFSAILVVSHESPGVSQFKKYFKLTEREMEIVLFTVSGLTNVKIAERLSITKRTVETHQNNIYNKIGVSNKIELLNVSGEFGIQR